MTQLQPVGGKNEINVNLKEDTQKLDEVVVVGYGTMKKKDLTGSVTAVKGDELAAVVPPNFPQLCKARFPE
mgnify:CR=1 FL=1